MDEVKEPLEFESMNNLMITTENKVLKGARKTVNSSRSFHRGQKTLNSKVIKRSDLSSGTIDTPINISDALNVGVSQTVLTLDLEDDKMPQNEQKISKTKTLNNGSISGNRDSLESTAVEYEIMSLQSRENSLDRGEKIYNKRSLEGNEFPIIDFNRETTKKFHHHDGIPRNIENENVSFVKSLRSHIHSPSNIVERMPSESLVASGDLTDRNLLLMQDKKKSECEQSSKPIDTFRSFPNILSIRNRMKEVKNVKCSDNGNLSSQHRRNAVNDTTLNFKNPYKKETGSSKCLTKDNLEKRIASKASDQNIRRMVSIRNNTSSTPASNIPNFAHMSNSTMYNTGPTYCVVPPPACRNVLIVPNQGFQTRYRYNIIGTASRGGLNNTDNQKPFVESSFPQRYGHAHKFASANTNYGYRFAPVYGNWRRNDSNFAYASKLLQNSNACEDTKNSNFVNFGHTMDASSVRRISSEPLNSSRIGEKHAIPNCTKIQSIAKTKSANCSSSTSVLGISNTVSSRARRWNETTQAADNRPQRKQSEVPESEASSKNREDYNKIGESHLKIKTPAVICRGQNIQGTAEEPKDENKLQDAQKKLSQVYELLKDIHERFVNGFECKGLENSLQIWALELERCILSVEKVKNVVSEYELKSARYSNRSQSNYKK